MKKSLVILSVFAVGLSYSQKATQTMTFSVEKEKVTNTSLPPGEREFNSKAEKQAYQAQAQPAKEITIMSEDATFPKYVKTGNKESDASSYAARKAEWIEKNPTKYEKMNANFKKNEKAIRMKRNRDINQKN